VCIFYHLNEDMLVGNKEAQDLLRLYLKKWLENEDSVRFFLLDGPSHIGKTSFVRQLANEILGDYYQSDFLWIRDCSGVLWKEHTLKISLPSDKKSHFIELKSGQLYEDIGTREINKWLQNSPMWKYKILYIENIDRMNISAVNAFLKTCEETLPWTVILASSANTGMLLDTLMSRAVQIRFQPLSYDEILKICQNENLFDDDIEKQEFVSQMVLWKAGLLYRYHNLFVENKVLGSSFFSLISVLKWNKIVDGYQLLIEIKNAGVLWVFLDGWIAYCQKNGLYDRAENWIKIKKMMQSNVNIDHLMLLGILDI